RPLGGNTPEFVRSAPRLLLAGTVLLAAALAGVLYALASGGGEAGLASVPPNSLARIDRGDEPGCRRGPGRRPAGPGGGGGRIALGRQRRGRHRQPSRRKFATARPDGACRRRPDRAGGRPRPHLDDDAGR